MASRTICSGRRSSSARFCPSPWPFRSTWGSSACSAGRRPGLGPGADGMEFLGAVVTWIAQPERWQGVDSIPARVGEHLVLSGVALALALVVALPVGIALGHFGRGGVVAINVANVGRALPSLALLALCLPLAFALGLGLGFWPTMFALVPLGIPPIVTNSYVALRAIDRDTVEVARGMGMHDRQVLRWTEIPIAAPIIIAGIRHS